MTLIKDIYDFIDKIAPFETAFSYDNCGLLVGSYESTVNKVLLSLDITKDVVKEAQKIGANLIISHHPIIFKPSKNINFESTLHLLCKFGINAICAHTNLDIAKNGVNYYLAKALNLQNLEVLTYEENKPLGLVGIIEEHMECEKFAEYVKSCLGCEGVRYTETDRKIKKIAVCSGSGGNLVKDAVQKNADALVTGEIKHDKILQANEFNLSIVDAGHFKTENVIIKPLIKELRNHFENIKFFESRVFTDNIKYI